MGGEGGGSCFREAGTTAFLRLIDHFEKRVPASGVTLFGKPPLYVNHDITIAESPVTPHSFRTNLPCTGKFGYIEWTAIEDAADFCGVEDVFAQFHRAAVLMDGLGCGLRKV